MKALVLVFVGGLVLVGGGSVGWGEFSATYSAAQDTFVDEIYSGAVNGGQVDVVMRNVNLASGELSTLIEFDVSDIPARATIVSATLGLYYWHFNSMDPVGRPVRAYVNTGAWDESYVQGYCIDLPIE